MADGARLGGKGIASLPNVEGSSMHTRSSFPRSVFSLGFARSRTLLLALSCASMLLGGSACNPDNSRSGSIIPSGSGSGGASPSGASGGSTAPAGPTGSGGSQLAAAGGSTGSGGSSEPGGSARTGGVSGSGTGGSAQTGGSTPNTEGSGGSAQTGGGAGNGPGGAPSAAGGSPNGGGNGSVAATGCSGKTYKLCEDFETGTAGALGPMWTKFNGYGAAGPTDVALATDAAHSGKMSLKSDSMDRGQQRAQRSLAAIGATAYKHWGRIFYKVQQPSPAPLKTATNTVIHITWTSMIGPGGENRVVDIVENMSGAHQWLFNIPSDGCCTSSAYNWKFDADWHCAEWWLDVSTNSYRFFSDSTEVPALAFSGKTNSTMSNYTGIIVGATWYQQAGTITSPFVIWFDDLAIDDNRIGCQ